MLGFYCEVYRREPLCRVYVNNILVDEFNITHTPRKDTWTPDMKLDPSYWSPEDYSMQSNTPFLKFIDFDDAGRKIVDIRIEIHNDDNNYANGFMTRHTRVMLSQCWLAPIKLWEDFDQICGRWKYSRCNWYNWHDHTESIAQYYSGLRNFALDNLATYADMHFTDITQQLWTKEQQKKSISNIQHLPRLWQYWPSRHWVGSSGHFNLTLKKKLGFWRHSTDRRRGWWKLSYFQDVKDFYDKYKDYEDTRSTDQ